MKILRRKSPFHVRCALWIAMGCAVFAPLACGGDDTSPSTTSGTGGAGGTGGTGGSGGEGLPDGATGAACGGFASLRCPDPDLSYCDYNDPSAICGQGDIQGLCKPRPSE